MDWVNVNDKLPKLDEVARMGHVLDEYNEKNFNKWGIFVVDMIFPRSKEVIVAEQKGNDFEEDVGFLTDSGWASNCDNVTHWKYK